MIVTGDNFEAEVLKADGLVIVDFWAEWCGPCKMVAPALESISTQHNLKLAKVDVDVEIKLASKYNIMSIPTIMLFKNGTIVNKIVGAVPRKTLEGIILQQAGLA